MKILVIAPLPPPITGQSLAVNALVKHLTASGHQISTVNMSGTRLHSGFSIGRIGEILRMLASVYKLRVNQDLVYLTVSESKLGALKDICVYCILGRQLDNTISHLHGGAGMRTLLTTRKSIIAFLLRHFTSKVKKFIILGRSHATMFNNVENESNRPSNLAIVPNFSSSELFLANDRIRIKFSSEGPRRLLFLSNMIVSKGYQDLLDAYLKLSAEAKKMIHLDFAGQFPDEPSARLFIETIRDHKTIRYHGPVSGSQKQDLLWGAHYICLPTYYPYEGQPITILEGYAAGCVPITTLHSGIPDIFDPDRNGYAVRIKSSDSILDVLNRIPSSSSRDCEIAISNHELAVREFTVERHLEQLDAALGLGQ